ncbi:MAG: tetratricopeptide repeat protein [Patescibacteria group bacterium]
MEKVETIKDLAKVLKNNLLFFAILAVTIIVVYGNIANGEFLNLDDNTGIIYNQDLRDFKGTLNNLSLGPIYAATILKLFGLNPTAFHVGSIIFHIIDTILIFVLAYLILGKKEAVVTSLLFAIHPVNSETVGWISSRGYLINSIFIITTLISFVVYKNSKNKKFLYTSIGIFTLNLLSMRDPWSLITPFIIMALDQFVFEKKIEWKNIKIYIPYIIVSIAFVLLNVVPELQSRVEVLETKHYLDVEGATPLLNRIPYTITMATRLLVFPVRLSIYHEGKVITSFNYSMMVLTAVIVVVTIIKLIKKNRMLAGFGMIIFLSMLPSFSPILIAWSIAERYLYIGSAFFCMIVAVLIFKAEEKTKMKDLVSVLVTIILIFYSVRTILRTNDLKNSKNLWYATKKTAPYSYRVYNNLGDVYANEGNYDLAIENFKKSVALRPGYADAIHNIGFSYLQKEDYEQAKQYLSQAYQMNPLLYQAAYKLGFISYKEGKIEEAKQYFEECLQLAPGNADCTRALLTINQALEN